MGKFKLRQRISLVILFVLFVNVLVSCSNNSKAERVSNEMLVQLREEYSYNNEQSHAVSMMSYKDAYPTFDAVLGVNGYKREDSYCAVVVLEFEGDWYDISTNVSIFNNENLNSIVETKTPGVNNIKWMVHNAKIKDILWGGNHLNKGDSIVVGFGSKAMTHGAEYEKVFCSGDQYVCFLFEEKDPEDFHVDALFSTAKPYSYYLTGQDVILSVTSAPGPDSVSGMYLDTFTTLVNETLGEPDAELTPVEPELEVE